MRAEDRRYRPHRFIWEELVGPIPPGYVVHHKNGDHSDNRVPNLACLPRQEHSSLHTKGRLPTTRQREALAIGSAMPNHGWHHTDETKVRISAAMRAKAGHAQSDETRAKISAGVKAAQRRRGA